MGWMLYLVGSTIGGAIGWALGERFGIMTAFLLSVVGTAVGVYGANRVKQRWF